MITSITLLQPDFFSIGGTTPEARETAVSFLIQNWDLQTVTNHWEDQIKTDLKDMEQLENVMEVFAGRVKDITKVCDDHVKDLNNKLDDRVNKIFQNLVKVESHFNQHGNTDEDKDEGVDLRGSLSMAELEVEAVLLASETRFKAIQKECALWMKHLEENRFKEQAQQDQDKEMSRAHRIHNETVRQIKEIQYKARSSYADFCVMKTENTAWMDPLAQDQEINFIKTKLLPTVNSNTKKAFFEKNREVTPLLIFLMAYWYVSGGLRQEVTPYFFNYDLRKEIQHLRSENISEDMSISSFQGEEFFVDFDEFNSLMSSLRDIPPIEKLLKISERMLENEEFMNAFFDCWDAFIDDPSDSCEACQTIRQRMEPSKTSLTLLDEASESTH